MMMKKEGHTTTTTTTTTTSRFLREIKSKTLKHRETRVKGLSTKCGHIRCTICQLADTSTCNVHCYPWIPWITFLETLKNTEKQHRNKNMGLDKERFWTQKLRTFHPHGLNKIPRPLERPVMPFVIPFSDSAIEISKIARDTFEQIKAIFPAKFPQTFVTAFCKNKNLKNTLVKSKFGNAPFNYRQPEGGNTKSPSGATSKTIENRDSNSAVHAANFFKSDTNGS